MVMISWGNVVRITYILKKLLSATLRGEIMQMELTAVTVTGERHEIHVVDGGDLVLFNSKK